MPSLAGISIANGYQKIITFFVKRSADNTTNDLSVEASDAVANGNPFEMGDLESDDDDRAIIGYLHIINASGSTFDGNVTALNAVGITTYYYNAYGRVGK